MKTIKNTDDMVAAIDNDAELEQEVRHNPQKALRENFRIVPVGVYRYVVIFLGLTILIVVIGYIIGIVKDKTFQLDGAIIALASAALGALGGLLAPQPNS